MPKKNIQEIALKHRSHIILGSIAICERESKQYFMQNPMEGAISRQEFQSRSLYLNKCQENLFY